MSLPNYFIYVYSDKEGWQELYDAVATIDEAVYAYRDALDSLVDDQQVEVEHYLPEIGEVETLEMSDYV